MDKVRYYWIDWMKVIGMFLIIWGHFFPKFSNVIIYSFNVPLFFCISGYLGGGGESEAKISLNTLFGNMHNIFSHRNPVAI